MKVYIVVTSYNTQIYGAFKTREAAQKAINYINRATSGLNYKVLDFEVEE